MWSVPVSLFLLCSSTNAWLSSPFPMTTMLWGHRGHRLQRNHVFKPKSSSKLALYLRDAANEAGFNNMTTTTASLSDGAAAFSGPGTTTSISASSTDTTSTSVTLKKGGRSNSNSSNFGDIMSPSSDDADVLFRDGLVTSATYSLAQMYGIHHPLDRMAVTANGNLQRLFSSYYDAPVTVVLDHCTKRKATPSTSSSSSTWERRVQLQVFSKTFCVADSVVQVHSSHCCALVESGQVGLGQLFRHLNILPEFALQAAGPTPEGGFWRKYTLTCAEVTCSITEQFCPGVWELKGKPLSGGGEAPAQAKAKAKAKAQAKAVDRTCNNFSNDDTTTEPEEDQ